MNNTNLEILRTKAHQVYTQQFSEAAKVQLEQLYRDTNCAWKYDQYRALLSEMLITLNFSEDFTILNNPMSTRDFVAVTTEDKLRETAEKIMKFERELDAAIAFLTDLRATHSSKLANVFIDTANIIKEVQTLNDMENSTMYRNAQQLAASPQPAKSYANAKDEDDVVPKKKDPKNPPTHNRDDYDEVDEVDEV